MKILVHAANANDACSFYRGVGPWSALAKSSPQEFQVSYISDPCWGDIRAADILFILRPTLASVVPIMQCARDWGTKIWVDWDDDPFCLHRDNPSYDLFQGQSVVETIRISLHYANLLTVSTNGLQRKFSQFNPDVRVIPNSFDTDLLRFRNPEFDTTNEYVLWRGTRTHDRDIDSVSEELLRVAGLNPKWKFVFVGSDPISYRVSEQMNNVVRIPMQDQIINYFKTIAALKPRIVIAPLADTEFNRSKSCIAALEGFFAGAACLRPLGWEEWTIPGTTAYDAFEGGFHSALQTLIDSPVHCQLLSREGYKYITEERTLHKTNLTKRREMAWELFEKMI